MNKKGISADARNKARRAVPAIVFVALLIGIFVAMIYFEQVNYVSTFEALSATFGGSGWVRSFSIAVVLSDALALAGVFTPAQKMRDEPLIVQILVTIWGVVVFFDTGLTWFFASIEMEKNITHVPAVIADVTWIFPIIVALMVTGVQIGLLRILAALLESLVYGKVITEPLFRARSGMTSARKPAGLPLASAHPTGAQYHAMTEAAPVRHGGSKITPGQSQRSRLFDEQDRQPQSS